MLTTTTTLVKRPFSRITWLNRHQNVSILDFTGAKDDAGGGDNWSYTCKAAVKSSPPTYHHPNILQAECPSCRPTNSIRTLKRERRATKWYKVALPALKQ